MSFLSVLSLGLKLKIRLPEKCTTRIICGALYQVVLHLPLVCTPTLTLKEPSTLAYILVI